MLQYILFLVAVCDESVYTHFIYIHFSTQCTVAIEY